MSAEERKGGCSNRGLAEAHLPRGVISALHPQGNSPQQQLLPALPSGGSEGAARPCPQHLRFSGSFIAEQNPRILSLLTVTVSPSRESGLGCSAPGIPGSASLITAREGQPGAKTSQAPIRAVSSHGGENWIWGREGAAGGKVNPSRHFTVGRQWGDGASSRCKA